MMVSTAKVFTSGNSQAVRLPKAFRVNVDEVWVTRNDHTGEITLTPKPSPDALATFLRHLRSAAATPEFVPPRDDAPAPSPLDGW